MFALLSGFGNVPGLAMTLIDDKPPDWNSAFVHTNRINKRFVLCVIYRSVESLSFSTTIVYTKWKF